MSFEGYFSVGEITELVEAFIDAGISDASAQSALRSALPVRYRAALSDSATAKTQLFLNLNQMNTVHNLRDGTVPLEQYLTAASLLASETKEGELIDKKLEQIRYSGPVPPPGISIAAAPPQGRVLNPAAALEAQTNAIDQTVSVDFLRNGVRAASSVVKILVHRHIDGNPESLEGDKPRLVNGTGWFIAPGLVITNHHVINARRKDGHAEPDATEQDFRLQAENTSILLDYVTRENTLESILSGPGALQYADRSLDFALLRFAGPAAARAPLRLRKNLIRKNLVQSLGTRVNLLQHPNGEPMRLGFRNNYVVVGDGETLSYLTDTSVGSSGSPVCDDLWSVAALHSGSRRISGTQVEILGHKFTRENFGSPIPAVLAHLEQHARPLHDEIVAAQA